MSLHLFGLVFLCAIDKMSRNIASNKKLPIAPVKRSSTPIPFTVYVKASRSIVSTSSSARQRRIANSAEYSMTPAEYEAFGVRLDGRQMRDVTADHLKILANPKDLNARTKYLEVRWDSSPREKYYFPVATSWRYGWVQSS